MLRGMEDTAGDEGGGDGAGIVGAWLRGGGVGRRRPAGDHGALWLPVRHGAGRPLPPPTAGIFTAVAVDRPLSSAFAAQVPGPRASLSDPPFKAGNRSRISGRGPAADGLRGARSAPKAQAALPPTAMVSSTWARRSSSISSAVR